MTINEVISANIRDDGTFIVEPVYSPEDFACGELVHPWGHATRTGFEACVAEAREFAMERIAEARALDA